MNSIPVALRSPEPASFASTATRPGRTRIAAIDLLDRLDEAAPVWERLMADDPVATPFADWQWIAAWQRDVGERAGFEPRIIVARDDHDAPLFLIPFALRRRYGLTTARYFGATHSHLNMGLWRRDLVGSVTAIQLTAVLADVAERAGIDLFMLRNQPISWDGCPNPLALLPHQPVPDNVYRLDFHGRNGEQVIKGRLKPNMRGVLRNKERKLEKLAGYRYFQASTAADVDRLLDAFLVQKAAQFAEHGVRNVFAESGMDEFLRAACKAGLAQGRPAIELHAIEGGGEALAILGGVAGQHRFSAMFNSYTLTKHGRWSPGLIILTHVIRNCADRGLDSFDLGVGYASYKWFFCKDIDPLIDSFLPFSARGRIAAAACRSGFALKRWIKTTPQVWNTVQTVRRALA
jgi:CelD/BcsL family acetyltransferase involved in cellulose biosynthesis